MKHTPIDIDEDYLDEPALKEIARADYEHDRIRDEKYEHELEKSEP